MPTLHVRNVCESLYKRIRDLARSEKRSLSAEVIALLDQAMADRQFRARQANTLAEIHRHRFTPSAKLPPAEDLVREDRER